MQKRNWLFRFRSGTDIMAGLMAAKAYSRLEVGLKSTVIQINPYREENHYV